MPLSLSRKQLAAAVSFLILFYVAISFWRMRVSYFPAHGDGCWYDMVARNYSQGRGLTEDCIWHYALPVSALSHPIGNYWNPLCPILVGTFYRFFGISKTAGQMPVFFMDGFLCLGIFFFTLKRSESLSLAFFSSLLFTVHRHTLTFRGGGGIPESVLLFFVTLCCYALIRAWEGRRLYYFAAAVMGGLAYLARNEGGLSLLAIVAVYVCRERSILRPASARDWLTSVLFLGSVLAVFGLVVAPWEIRNRLLYGSAANAAKFHFFFARDWGDVWSYSQTFGLKAFLSMGWRRVLAVVLTSYYYKLDFFVETISWPLAIFLPLGWIATRDQSWRTPVSLYFLITYLVMGILNTIGQQTGWHGSSSFLPFVILMALSGIAFFSRSVTRSPRTARMLTLALSTLLVGYHLGDNARYLHRAHKNGGDPKEMPMHVISQWFQSHPQPVRPILLTHFAYQLTYYSGIPSVKIPAHDPLPVVWLVAKKYGCTHLVLTGDVDEVFRPIYQGVQKDPHIQLLEIIPFRVTLENGGDQIQIYKIR